MEQNEVLKELIGSLVTEDLLHSAIREIVYEYVDRKFDDYLRKAIAQKIEVEICEKGDDYIRTAIDGVINGKVRIDDGWGNRQEEFGTFEDLVRRRIAKNLSDGWKVEQKVRDAVDANIKRICQEVRKEHVDNMAEQVLERLASEGKQTT